MGSEGSSERILLVTSKHDWISPEDREYFRRIEESYLKWCEKNGVEPYACAVEGCDNKLPCRKHPPEVWDDE